MFCSSVCRSYKIDAAKKGPRASPAKRVAWGKGAAVEHEKALAFARALESRNLPRRGGQRRVISTIFSLLDTFFNVIKSALYRHFRRKAFLNVHNENIDIRKKRVRIVYRNNKKSRPRVSASGPFSILCIKHSNASASSPAPLFQNFRTGRISAHTVYFRENPLCKNPSYQRYLLRIPRYNSAAEQP